MGSATASDGAAAARRPVAIIVAVIGVIGVIIGLLYLFAGGSLPHFMAAGSHVHSGNHLIRGLVCLVVGLVLIYLGWRASRAGARRT